MAFLPSKGFLGTGATFEADFNLIVQLAMGTALIAGVCLARQERYRAHGICQTTVLLLNLLMIASLMWPSFHQQVKPRLSRIFHESYYAVPTVHALLGMAAEILGLYIVVVTKTDILPIWLRFRNWKRWMRTEFVLWLIVLASGATAYYVWYIAPFR
jgi:uncharacterized membrane protein YozB (DUF420 family)